MFSVAVTWTLSSPKEKVCFQFVSLFAPAASTERDGTLTWTDQQTQHVRSFLTSSSASEDLLPRHWQPAPITMATVAAPTLFSDCS